MQGEASTQVVLTQGQLDDLLTKAVAAAPSGTTSPLSEEHLEAVCSRAVVKTFTALGLDVHNPIETQKDFAFIRSLRIGTDTLRSHGLKTAIGIIVTAIVSMCVVGAKALLPKANP